MESADRELISDAHSGSLGPAGLPGHGPTCFAITLRLPEQSVASSFDPTLSLPDGSHAARRPLPGTGSDTRAGARATPKRCARSCWPGPPRPHSSAGAPSAAAATCRRAGMALDLVQHRAGAVDEQRAQILSPRLLMPSKVVLPPVEACRAPPPGRRPLPAVREALRIPDRGHQRAGRQRTDARDRRQPPARFGVQVPRWISRSSSATWRCKCSRLSPAREQLAKAARQLVGAVLQDLRQTLADRAMPCGITLPNSPSSPRI